ncbi:universal stress protein UspE [bacterium BMS3Abin10]|nr:universal stress protein UspE [bacterium BMS3Abin10]GBE38530.1 universal stress protein UspE [bacterium BMS3Bbin08]
MKILLTTDGSENSDGAAKFLNKLQFTADDEISIFYVIGWVPILSEWEALFPDFQVMRKDVAPKVLESCENILKTAKAKVSSSFMEGYPDKSIIDTAEDTGVDLVVMGARGKRGVGSYIVGSVTRLVTINSRKPVLVIRPLQWGISGSIKILFATDGSEHSDAMAKLIASMPFPDDTEITVLNVIPSPFEDIPERFAMEINDRIKRAVADARTREFKESGEIIEKTCQLLSNKYSRIEDMAKIGDPSAEILKTAEALKTNIIAVGSSGRRGIRGVLGSVSRHILNSSACSVLIGKS